MTERWKVICKLKDVPLQGARLVPRGLVWQDLPGVALFRAVDDKVYALLDCSPACAKGAGQGGSLAQGVVAGSNLLGPRNSWMIELDTGRQVAPEIAYVRTYRVRIADGRVYLDLNEMNTPASRAEWALAGSLAVLPHLQMA